MECEYEGKKYPDGTKLSLTGETLVCNNGRWEREFDRRRQGLTIAPGEDLSDI